MAGTTRWSRPKRWWRLGNELTEGGADWQIHAMAMSATASPTPMPDRLGIRRASAYNEAAERRSWASLEDFLAEVFG